jgi:hypothetical protein
MSQNIDLHIEELVLHGFAPEDRYRIGAAVERELARLLAERGVPPGLAAGAEIAGLDGGAFQVAPGARPEAIGAQVAQAVYDKVPGSFTVQGEKGV